MKSLLLFSGFLFFAGVFTKCNICSCKKVACQAFEDVNFENWFSYQQGQQIIFKYQSSYDTIDLLPFQKSEGYEASQGCYHPDPGCTQTLSIASHQTTVTGRQKFLVDYTSVTPFGSSSSTKSIKLFLNGFDCPAVDINDNGLVLKPGIYSGLFSASVTINGTVYNNIQVVTRDTLADNSARQPYKIYLSKGIGLIAYEMYPTHQLWVKQ